MKLSRRDFMKANAVAAAAAVAGVVVHLEQHGIDLPRIVLRQRHKLLGVQRINAGVVFASDHQHRWHVHASADVVIRRVAQQPSEISRFVGVAVLRDPVAGDAEFVIAHHVEQRHRAHDAVEQIRPLRRGSAYQPATVAATKGHQPLVAGVTLTDQPFGAGVEIVKHVLLVAEHAAFVPALAELVTTAQTRLRHDDATVDQGGKRAEIADLDADVEAAVAVDDGRVAAVELDALFRAHEHRHFGAVTTGHVDHFGR